MPTREPEGYFVTELFSEKAPSSTTQGTQILDDILEKIKSYSPSFFDQLVVDVLVKMGYGGSLKDATRQ